MAGDLIREVRRAILAHMKADKPLAALVPPASMYPATTKAVPDFPFTRFDAPQSLPLDGACYAGATVSFLLHGFAKARFQGGLEVETAEDHASRIGSAMKTAIHNRRVAIGNDTARISVQSARLVRDGADDTAYHAILSVQARVLAA